MCELATLLPLAHSMRQRAEAMTKKVLFSSPLSVAFQLLVTITV